MLIDQANFVWLDGQGQDVNVVFFRERHEDFRHDYELLAREVQLLDSVPEHNLRLPV